MLLLERDFTQPDRIVGELLQPGGYLMLKRLGLERCTEGIDAQKVLRRGGAATWMCAACGLFAALPCWPLLASGCCWLLAAAAAAETPNQLQIQIQIQTRFKFKRCQVFGYALYKGGRYARVKYPTEGYSGDVAGRSFHHGRFVQRLRHAAAGVPGVTAREGTVRRLLNRERTWVGRVAGCCGCRAAAVCAGAVAAVLCGCGCGVCVRALRTVLRRSAPPRPSKRSQHKTTQPNQHQNPQRAVEGGDWAEGEPVSGVQYKTGDGAVRTARAHLTVVCDGMYSQFRKQLAEPTIRHPSYFVGLLLKGVQLPFPNHGHVVLAKPSPILFYPISSGEVRAAWFFVDAPLFSFFCLAPVAACGEAQ